MAGSERWGRGGEVLGFPSLEVSIWALAEVDQLGSSWALISPALRQSFAIATTLRRKCRTGGKGMVKVVPLAHATQRGQRPVQGA